MNVWTLTAIPVVSMLLYVWWPESPRSREEKTKRPFHAIKIHPCKNACECAKRIQGKRILSSEFVTMKTRECTKPQCNCTFEHFDDRRSGFDRRSFAPAPHPELADKRRLSFGRRVTDVHNKARTRSTIQPANTPVPELGGIISESQT